jgi:hypothetical protein
MCTFFFCLGLPLCFCRYCNRLERARVGAMDVSWSEAQRAETNVIARSDDRATTRANRSHRHPDDRTHHGTSVHSLSSRGRYHHPLSSRGRYHHSLSSRGRYIHSLSSHGRYHHPLSSRGRYHHPLSSHGRYHHSLSSRGRYHHPLSSRGRRCGRLRSCKTPLRSVLHSHPSPLLTPLSRRLLLSSMR